MMHTLSFLPLFVLLGAPLEDPWEDASDDSASTLNEMVHGDVQRGHTLVGTPGDDADWVALHVAGRRSYEARVGSGTLPWFYNGVTIACVASCARFARVDVAGSILTPGAGPSLNLTFPTQAGTSVVRWIAPADAIDYLRVTQEDAAVQGTYDIAFFDTTLDVPRFNNSATQITVVIVRNGNTQAANGQLDFYLPTGAHQHSVPFTLAANATFVLNTASVPALQGVGGSATVAHTAGYGGFTGKAVAVEPANGFTFDTMMTSRP